MIQFHRKTIQKGYISENCRQENQIEVPQKRI